MIEGKMVRIRFRKDDAAQPLWVFLGKVVHFSTDWVGVDGKGVLVYKRQSSPNAQRTLKGHTMYSEPQREGGMLPTSVDEEKRILMFPREVIANIRILPDDFDLDSIYVKLSGRRIDLVVDGAPDSAIDEMHED